MLNLETDRAGLPSRSDPGNDEARNSLGNFPNDTNDGDRQVDGAVHSQDQNKSRAFEEGKTLSIIWRDRLGVVR